ncbi:MAG: hypothetical protein AVDCRST_MAG50-366 [uncultured Acidimicrobiales bacterium]|uniref:MobA-like NTP transferase domain-containing protein n=1 Tax=uncultured Acidimicrobiales bacterium TaxID=310071 RepID=A0A6J4H6F3_9ACTN|nr:MAG: hypothetical protein AVDCRST_MAG50-366 [uncultured Acidimicrobiales bacterium]
MTSGLLVLAAGLGSRFGGDKQIAGVGPNGEALIDYTLHDAVRIGFDPIVLVVRSDIRELVNAHLVSQGWDPERFLYAEQDRDTSAPARAKPWGTAHAIVSARQHLKAPFAVVNADDMYGPRSLETAAALLEQEWPPGVEHLVGFDWTQTLAPTGTVNRGVCEVDDEGWLVGIRETRGVDRSTALAPGTLVSMNLWGFSPEMVDRLADRLAQFISSRGHEPDAEYQIPDCVAELLASGEIRVRVEASSDQWIGVTHREDLSWAQARLAELVSEGTYPHRLNG